MKWLKEAFLSIRKSLWEKVAKAAENHAYTSSTPDLAFVYMGNRFNAGRTKSISYRKERSQRKNWAKWKRKVRK